MEEGEQEAEEEGLAEGVRKEEEQDDGVDCDGVDKVGDDED